MENQNHIGKVVHFDEPSFSASKRAFEAYIIPALTQVQKAFEKLRIGKFSQETFLSLCQKGISEIKKCYDETVSEELSKMKQLPAVSSSIAEYISEHSQFGSVQKAWQKAEEIKAVQSLGVLNTKVDYSFITFDEIKDDWVLNTEALKRSYQKIIETDAEAEAFEALIQFQKAHATLRKAVSKIPKSKNRFLKSGIIIPILPDSNFSDDCLMFEDNEGEAQISLSSFADSVIY
jgi:hypothetical protein